MCDWMTSRDIMFTVRGSATGSLLCYLLGITIQDPIHWGLSFDRFLSKDRIMPPDIDLDVEHLRRDEVLDYIDREFYSLRITLDSTYSYQEDDQGRPAGSLFKAWQTRARNIGAGCIAGLRSIGGGEVPEMTNLLARSSRSRPTRASSSSTSRRPAPCPSRVPTAPA